MSEYLYYEFRAVDRPLDAQAKAALREITSRAKITSTSLINEYHYRDFKGDCNKLMDKYFDAHLYLANWGTRQLMLRLPVPPFALESAKPYCAENCLSARGSKDHVVLNFLRDGDFSDEYYESIADCNGILDDMLPLRADLMMGDLRCLYIFWLTSLENESMEDRVEEPPVPPGLGNLSPPYLSFMEFFGIDPMLVEVAARASSSSVPTGPSLNDLTAWIENMPRAQVDLIVARLMQGESNQLMSELQARFSA